MSVGFSHPIALMLLSVAASSPVVAQPMSEQRYIKCVLNQADDKGKFVPNAGKAGNRRLLGFFYEISHGSVIPDSLRVLDKTSLVGSDLINKVTDSTASVGDKTKIFSVHFNPNPEGQRLFWMTPNPVPKMRELGLWFGQLSYADTRTGLPKSSNSWGGVCGWSKAADVRLQFESDSK